MHLVEAGCLVEVSATFMVMVSLLPLATRLIQRACCDWCEVQLRLFWHQSFLWHEKERVEL